MSTFSCENVHVNYGPVRALTGASFTLDTGRICGLIGMNGSGKSTLQSHHGVVPMHAGSITLDGQPVGGKLMAAARTRTTTAPDSSATCRRAKKSTDLPHLRA